MPFPGDGWRRSPLSVALSGVISKIAVRVINFFALLQVTPKYSHLIHTP
jgi:hypothetical protein